MGNIEHKPQRCKGTGKAKGYGCGKLVLERRYGLGYECRCFPNWLYKTESGKKVLSANTLSAQKKVRAETKREKAVESVNVAGKLQLKVQEIARLLDVGHECLARGKMALKYDGGHVWGKGGHSECKYNLHNIFAQDSKSNQSTKEDALMVIGVERVFGKDYFDFVESLKNKPIISHSKVEMAEMYRRACKEANKLKKDGLRLSTDERISKRNEINKIIGYYPDELAEFKQ